MNRLNEIFDKWRDTYSKAGVGAAAGLEVNVMSRVVQGWLPANPEERLKLQEKIVTAINERSETTYTIDQIWPTVQVAE